VVVPGEDANWRKGGSATMAVEVLKSRGVPEDRILFLNLIASPEGIDGFAKRFPKLRVVTAFIDQVSISPVNKKVTS